MVREVDGTSRRAAAWGLGTRMLEPGRWNAITDVPGVRVGHATLTEHESGAVARTGVTVVMLHDGDPWAERLYAGSFALNGFGQLTCRDVIDTTGMISTPVFLTGTRSVGSVYEGAVRCSQRSPASDNWVFIPVVGECDDSYLSDPVVTAGEREVEAALADAHGAAVEEGAVGAGTGMALFGYKGGIGTASRVVRLGSASYTVGVLLLTNFGRADQIRLPSGYSAPPGLDDPPQGSCIGLVVTDAPLHPQQLSRVAQRIGFGLVRTGSTGNDGSGEIFLAVSTATRIPHRSEGPLLVPVLVDEQSGGSADTPINAIFDATVEATEEAVWNALVAARRTTGRLGRHLDAFADLAFQATPSPWAG